IREKLGENKTFAQALEQTKQECIFTTHTPVEAGHDRFSSSLMNYALNKTQIQLNLRPEELMALGRVHPTNADEPFCMPVVALKASRAANGVSELHGRISREMWKSLYPNKSADEVPIGHITNGVHLLGWMKGPVRRFWRRKLSAKLAANHFPAGDTTNFWTR